jgi:hypothetical protein
LEYGHPNPIPKKYRLSKLNFIKPLCISPRSPRFFHAEITMDLKDSHRRASLNSERSVAIGVDLEKEWDRNVEKTSTSGSSSIHEPEKARTKDSDIEDQLPHHHDHDLEGTPVRRTVTAQDWTGPDDPENPHNWPIWKRVWHTVPPALLAFIV